MSTGTKAVFFCCIALLVVGLLYRSNIALEPARPRDMPEGSRFIATGYDLEHNEREGTWVSCETGEGLADQFCVVTDAKGTVIFQGDFLPVRAAVSSPVTGNASLATHGLGWVDGPAEGSPIPVIPRTDGSMLVPRDDRDALLDRWNQHPDEWQRLQGAIK